ncbi:MAG: FecR domain-containing protein [Deltaproteobacteria bacterium]|nr:FecR domain-containing protein [Deltaproteobacteria bacterium]
MKKTPIFLLSFLLIVFFAGRHVTGAERVTTVKIGKDGAIVSFLEGTAKVLSGGKKDWRPLKKGEALQGGDEVRTGAKSKLEITMPDKSLLRFADDSRFKIMKIDVSGEVKGKEIKVHMAIGRAWANVSRTIGGKKNFELSCENAVAGVRGTVYRMNVNDDKSALVRVYDGEVHVAGGGKVMEQPTVVGPPQPIAGPKPVPGPRKVTMEEWTYIIKTMQQIRIGADGSAEKPRDFTEKEDRDAWVDWNKSRDGEPR